MEEKEMEEKRLKTAKQEYEKICKVLDKLGCKSLEKHEEDLIVVITHKGEDMIHRVLFRVEPKAELIIISEQLPFSIVDNKKEDIAMAVCKINDRIGIGNWIYDLDKKLSYEIRQLYTGSLIGEEVLLSMFFALIDIVEASDDKLLAINKGYLKNEDF